ncbi:MAG: redoxin domain-containing protein [Terriglobia bacterium]
MSEKRMAKIGDPAPDLAWLNIEGNEIRLSDYRGKRVVLFVWASWCSCREQLADWQLFYREHRPGGVEVIGIAMDGQGAAHVKPLVEQAKVEFPVVVDSVDCLWDLFGFEYLPNGYYVDERGVIRYLKVGGFDIRDTINRKILEDLVTDKWAKHSSKIQERPKTNFKKDLAALKRQVKGSTRGHDKRLKLCELYVKTGQPKKALKEYDIVLDAQPKNARALFARGAVALRLRKVREAISLWKRAFAIEPNNWVIRKQLWALENPERFYPRIDHNWQNEQIRREELQAEAELKSRPKAKAHRI